MFTACQQQGQQAAASDSSLQDAALQAPYPKTFYDSLKTALKSYYLLTDALVATNDIKTNERALVFKRNIDSLPVALLRSDSSIYTLVTATKGDISAELTGMMAETGMEKKRLSFEMVSDMLYDMLKSTGLQGTTIYRQYCPMAFNDKGAYWLSDNTTIRNPYFGDEMLNCGSVTDTLKYQ